jgi:hypothetical protein
MKIDVSITPEMLAAIQSEAKVKKVTVSYVVREIIGATYGFQVTPPRQQSQQFTRRPH